MTSCFKDKLYEVMSVSEFLDPHFHACVHSIIHSL